MSVMRVRYKKQGGHYHCRVFTAHVPTGTYEKNGDLVFDERQWEEAKRILSGCEFLEEGEEPGNPLQHGPAMSWR